MRTGKAISLFLGGLLSLMAFNANAAGYMGHTKKDYTEGWACNPATPNYSGWVHFWRDDGKFLGALHAAQPREAAVGEICADAGYHGFAGAFDYPSDFLDNQWHKVRGYHINQDNSVTELQNSWDVLFDGGPQPYVFTYQSANACIVPSAFADLPGWLMSATPLSSSVYCPQLLTYSIPNQYVYVGDPAIPTGSEVEICAIPKTLAKIPAGWQVVSVVNSNTCIKQYNVTIVGNYPPSFHNIIYVERLKIRKVN